VDSLSAYTNWTQQQEVTAQLDTNMTQIARGRDTALRRPTLPGAESGVMIRRFGTPVAEKIRFQTSVTSKLRRVRLIDLMEIS
jgi:hypothetical protein